MAVQSSFTIRSIVAALIALWPVVGARAATITAQVNANVVKPLAFSAKQNLDFGTISVPNSVIPFTVTVAQTGTRVCPAPLVCSGIAKQAIFNVQGSNAQVVRIVATASDLINSSDGSKIRFTPLSPVSVTLTNSGFPGNDFNLGGSIVIPANVSGGLYTGDIEITADYQ